MADTTSTTDTMSMIEGKGRPLHKVRRPQGFNEMGLVEERMREARSVKGFTDLTHLVRSGFRFDSVRATLSCDTVEGFERLRGVAIELAEEDDGLSVTFEDYDLNHSIGFTLKLGAWHSYGWVDSSVLVDVCLDRSKFCERVQVGTEVRERKDYSTAQVVSEEVPVYEWRCQGEGELTGNG